MSLDLSSEELLFAVCAVQIGVVTPIDIARAAAKKTHQPDRTIPDLLQADGLLTAEQHERITQWLTHAILGGQETLESLAEPSDSRRDQDRPTEEFEGPPVSQPREARSSVVLFDEIGEKVTTSQPGRYTVRGVHFSGPHSRILVAFDEHIGREVAIKEFLPGRGKASSQPDSAVPAVVRFLREARVTAQLEHPNIIPVHELGHDQEGKLYYTMRLVRGETLETKLNKCRNLAERLKLLGVFWDLCKAIAFAHSRGVVHRDIKPLNVMVGEFGETIILDWGVAKVAGKQDLPAPGLEEAIGSLGADTPVTTLTGTTIGTPGYMSPEQARGRVDEVDERSDVWGLGALLYEILTGRPPYEGPTPAATVALVGAMEPQPVAQIEPGAPPELVAVVEKALRPDRRKRYQSARELAEEVSNYLTGGRVHAYGYSSWELLRRFASKNKGVLVAATLAFLAILGTLVAVAVLFRREQVERRLANFHLAQAYAEKADRLVDELRLPAARVFAAASLLYNPAHPQSPFFTSEFSSQAGGSRELLAEAASVLVRVQAGPGIELERSFPTEGLPAQLVYSPDGKFLAVACQDGGVHLWDLEHGWLERTLSGHSDKVHGLAFSPDGRTLASASSDRTVILWEPATGRRLQTLTGHENRVNRVAFSPNGRRLASAGFDGSVRIWSVKTGRAVKVLRGHAGAVHDVAFAPDGRKLASVGADRTVRIWDLKRGLELQILKGHANTAARVSFSPGGQVLASAGYDGKIFLWDPTSGQGIASLTGHSGHIYGLAFSPDGTWLASGGFDSSVRFWDVSTGVAFLRLDAHQAGVFGLAFSPDGGFLATDSQDRSVKIWKLLRGAGPVVLSGHSDRIYAMAYSPDGKSLATGSWDRSVAVWDLAAGKPRWVQRGHGGYVNAVAINPDQSRLASTSWDGSVKVWDLDDGHLLYQLPGHGGLINPAVFSPDGSLLMAGLGEQGIGVWQAQTGAPLRTLEGHKGKVLALAVSPDGKRLLSAGEDKLVRIWNLGAGTLERTLSGHADRITGVDWSPDGRWIASSGADRTAIVWDAGTGDEVRRLEGHDLWVNAVRFSPDSRWLATASDDRTVRIWLTETGEPVLILRTKNEVMAIRFSPDGKTLALGDGTQVVLQSLDFPSLHADPARLLEDAERALGKTLEGFQLKTRGNPAAVHAQANPARQEPP